MKRWKRSKKVTAALCVCFMGAAGIGYAWSIPGVTEPYDPPNYYSPKASPGRTVHRPPLP